MVYQCRSGFRLVGDANAIGHEIETLGDEISTESIVELARDEKTVLHSNFEWDDSKAAHGYRLDQARGIMQALVIVEEAPGSPEPEVIVRAFESIAFEPEDEGEQGRRAYVPIRKALNDIDMREQIMGRLVDTIESATDLMNRYEHLVPVFAKAKRHMKIAVDMIAKAKEKVK